MSWPTTSPITWAGKWVGALAYKNSAHMLAHRSSLVAGRCNLRAGLISRVQKVYTPCSHGRNNVQTTRDGLPPTRLFIYCWLLEQWDGAAVLYTKVHFMSLARNYDHVGRSVAIMALVLFSCARRRALQKCVRGFLCSRSMQFFRIRASTLIKTSSLVPKVSKNVEVLRIACMTELMGKKLKIRKL